jgi:hypothetical protein
MGNDISMGKEIKKIKIIFFINNIIRVFKYVLLYLTFRIVFTFLIYKDTFILKIVTNCVPIMMLISILDLYNKKQMKKLKIEEESKFTKPMIIALIMTVFILEITFFLMNK